MFTLSSRELVRSMGTPLALAIALLGGGNVVRAQGAPKEFVNPLAGGLPGGARPGSQPGAAGDPARPSDPSGSMNITITIDTSDPAGPADDGGVDALWQRIQSDKAALHAKLFAANGTSQDLYRLWLAREAAREAWTRTGLQSEAVKFNQYQAQIEQNQLATWTTAKAFYQDSAALLKEYAANNPDAADQCHQFIAELQNWANEDYKLCNSTFGLKNDKYIGFPQITRQGTLTDQQLKNFMDPNNPSESIR